MALVALVFTAVVAAPQSAHAGTGKWILETMGVSIAVGTVLGASTLPFYDEPGKHIDNVAIGAAIGGLVGASLLGYGAIRGHGDNHASYREPSWPEPTPARSPRNNFPRALAYSPIVSLTW